LSSIGSAAATTGAKKKPRAIQGDDAALRMSASHQSCAHAIISKIELFLLPYLLS
jgi:hypothetical protein